MKHKLPIIGIVMIVALAALTGGGVCTQTGAGVASTITPEAVPERRIDLIKGITVQKGWPPGEAELQIFGEIMIAEISGDGGDAVTEAAGKDLIGCMQNPVKITSTYQQQGMIVAPAG